MRFATISAMLMAAATHAVLTTGAMADGRGHGSFGMSHGGQSQGLGMRVQSGALMSSSGMGMKNYSQVQKSPVFNHNVMRVPVLSNNPIKSNMPLLNPGYSPRDRGHGQGYKKPIDLGIVKKPQIDLGFGQGKKPIDLGVGKLPQIDPGFGSGKKPIDLGVGKNPQIDPGFGQGKKPIDLGIGKGGGIKIDPGLIGKIKNPNLPFNPGIKIPIPGKPKIPICPPHKFPNHPPHWCPPCPPIFLGWCWYPGFGNCYGYAGGLGLPVVVNQPIVQLPPADVLANGAMPQIVPGTTVVANVMGAGDQSGRVMMQYNSVALMAEVVKWEGEKVTFVVPAVALQQPVEVKLVFLRANGEVAQEVAAELVAVTVEQQP